jgi:hypothetical protein
MANENGNEIPVNKTARQAEAVIEAAIQWRWDHSDDRLMTRKDWALYNALSEYGDKYKGVGVKATEEEMKEIGEISPREKELRLAWEKASGNGFAARLARKSLEASARRHPELGTVLLELQNESQPELVAQSNNEMLEDNRTKQELKVQMEATPEYEVLMMAESAYDEVLEGSGSPEGTIEYEVMIAADMAYRDTPEYKYYLEQKSIQDNLD